MALPLLFGFLIISRLNEAVLTKQNGILYYRKDVWKNKNGILLAMKQKSSIFAAAKVERFD